MTQLSYLSNTYLYNATATLLEETTHEKGQALVLDQTIFYPQGGGQPADHGTIEAAGSRFVVSDVRLTPEGIALHFGAWEGNPLQANTQVALNINQERRLQNAKIHSAGHLLDCAVEKIGLTQITPTKGYHFPEGPYVEYEGELENANDYTDQLHAVINDLIQQDLPFHVRTLNEAQAKAEGVIAPAGKSARVVSIGDFQGCGCGGTHIASAAEIGPVTVRKMKSKKGITRITYALAVTA